MRYAFKDLGEQPEGATVVVALEGSAANVLLLDPVNYSLYQAGSSFSYYGGLQRESPVRLTVPHDGRWYLAVDLGGYRGRVRARLQAIEPPSPANTEAGRRQERMVKVIS